MQFNSPEKKIPYLNAREQRKMLAMAMTLVFVIVAIQWAAMPENWHWIAPPEQNPQAQSRQAASLSPSDSPELEPDTSGSSRGPLPPGVFISQLPKEGANEGADPGADPGEEQGDDQSVGNVRNDEKQVSESEADPRMAGDSKLVDDSQADTQPEDNQVADAELPSMKELLVDVSDDTVGVRAKELNAYYGVLKHASQTTPAELKKAKRDVTYANLLAEPGLFRGQLIQFDGEARRIQPISAQDNSFGVGNLFEAWIITRDSGQDLFRVVFQEVGEGITVSDSVSVPVTVTGYFFKRQGYASINGQRVAPLILSKGLEKTKFETTELIESSLAPYMIGFAVIVGVTAVVAIWFYGRGDRKFEREERKKFTAASEEALEALKELGDSK